MWNVVALYSSSYCTKIKNNGTVLYLFETNGHMLVLF